MKKSNKNSFLYIFSSVSLLLTLIFGGCYGIYMSVGLSFVRQGVSNLTSGGARNVSFGGSVNFETSMIGVIILSIALIVLSVIDFISLTKQVVFFKQFSVVKNSKMVKDIEQKSKGKGSIIFFAILIDILSFIAGIMGIIINMKTFRGGGMIWLIYVIDGLISVLSIASIILLIVKLKKLKSNSKPAEKENVAHVQKEKPIHNDDLEDAKLNTYDLNLNDIEYKLMKLKQLKNSRIITKEEYEELRKKVIKRDDGNYIEKLSENE